ncbi:hypothetical protein BDR26DRAFT_477193 [Obelidium mucronatum]|nr:hypothetical protein BDR26DRAFT_477193 [Obelidium mucronatum]
MPTFSLGFPKLRADFCSTTYVARTLSPLNGPNAYDCIGVLAYGLDKIARQFSSLDFTSPRSFQSFLNYTAFKNTGYVGFTNNPVQLSDRGDAALPFQVFQVDNSYSVTAFAQTDLALTRIDYNGIRLPNFAGNTSTPPPDGRIYTSAIITPIKRIK